jgi:two-component system, sensor histidine kinase RegB
MAEGESVTPLDHAAGTVAARTAESERLDPTAIRTHFAWLLRLRWGAIGGQAATILLVDRFMRVSLPLMPLYAIVLVELASNLALTRYASGRRSVSEGLLVAVMAADVLLLTLLLYFAGGPFNPFNFLYLVHIALAAVVLRSRFTWALAALSFLCFGALFLEQGFQESHAHAGHGGHSAHTDMALHLYGMWVAFGVAAVFIAYFVTRVTRDLARREQELAETRALAARSQQLASLATLAAGAAHELSTPLSTIAIVAKELERELSLGDSRRDHGADARLIRDEVARCRAILAQMAAHAAPGTGDGLAEVMMEQLIEAALSGMPARERVRLALDSPTRALALRLPAHAVTQALRCLLQNALQAVADGGEVSVGIENGGGRLTIEVRDTGVGMTQAVLARAGEPFFTTKEPGQGMGLGLFVSRAALERVGGQLELESTPGQGTRARLHAPAQRCDKIPHGARTQNQRSLEAE